MDTLNASLQVVYSRYKSDRRRADIIETAFHEAGHAVISLTQGGRVHAAELHFTLAEQKKHGGWGACGILGLEGYADAKASLAGPLTAKRLTGFVRKGSDFPMAESELAICGIPLDQACQDVERDITQHWSSIERVAALLLSTAKKSSPTRFNTIDLRHLVHPGTRTVANTQQDISAQIRQAWISGGAGTKRTL